MKIKSIHLLALSALLLNTNVYAQQLKNVVVASETDRFKAWPANNGMWKWGDEMLVMYTDATPDFSNTNTHTYDRKKETFLEQARSLDGGLTWKIEKGKIVKPGKPAQTDLGFDDGNNGPNATDLQTPINFTDPNFAFTIRFYDPEYGFSIFWYSYDKGKSWEGPYKLPALGFKFMAARPNYIVNSSKDMMAVVTVDAVQRNTGRFNKKDVLIQTVNGGLTWKYVSDAGKVAANDTKNSEYDSIMGSLTRISPTKLISLHRMWDSTNKFENSWMEDYISEDNGKSFKFASIINTGNSSTPPSVTKLPNGRLVVTYGYRTSPFGIRARISDDEGKSWSNEIILRSDGGNFDLGYTRDALREDGKLVTAYYFNTNILKDRKIEATIWDPNDFFNSTTPTTPITPTPPAGTQAPISLDKCKVWLKANDIGGVSQGIVTEWKNNCSTTLKVTTNGSPSVNTTSVANMQVVSLDGVNDDFTIKDKVFDSNNASVFFVIKSEGDNAGKKILDSTGDSIRKLISIESNGLSGFGSISKDYVSNKFLISTSIIENNFATEYINGNKSDSVALKANINTASLNELVIGARYSHSDRFKGQIAEVLIYDKAISNDDRIKIEKYLSDKWAVDFGTSTQPAVTPTPTNSPVQTPVDLNSLTVPELITYIQQIIKKGDYKTGENYTTLVKYLNVLITKVGKNSTTIKSGSSNTTINRRLEKKYKKQTMLLVKRLNANIKKSKETSSPKHYAKLRKLLMFVSGNFK